MEYTVKKHSKQEFYETYEKWLFSHNFPILNENILGENMFVCYNGEIPIYAVPFWFTDSKIGILAFVVSNKNVNYKKKIGGLDYLISEVIKYAKRKNLEVLYSTTTTESIITSLKNNNFVNGDLDSSQFFLNFKK